jgi:hypothetical protein
VITILELKEFREEDGNRFWTEKRFGFEEILEMVL